MVSTLLMNLALLGAEWVLYLLIVLSVVSVALILDRVRFTRARAATDLEARVRELARARDTRALAELARRSGTGDGDFTTALALALAREGATRGTLEALGNDAILRTRIEWDRGLGWLATIGSNAPFVGLFGTVLGIIQAFNEISRAGDAAAGPGVSAGLSEALIATAVGILVAIPATVAFNLFTRRTRQAVQSAEALKSFLVAELGKD